MPLHAGVTQAPIASRRNGGTAADSRQYFARRTQRANNGPRIAAAIAGMAPGEFRTVWANNANRIFDVYNPEAASGTNDILDWTPHGVWDEPTRQVLIGGRRGLTKIIAYADLVGDWRQLQMPADFGRLISGTVHYYGRIARNPLTGVTYFGSSESIGKVWAFNPVTEQYTRLADTPTANGGNGASFEWLADTARLVCYAGDAERWMIYTPGTDSWVTAANGIGHGQHNLLRYHPAHSRCLLLGGTGSALRASFVTSAGAVTLLADMPQETGYASGAWIHAHPAGCWLVKLMGTTPTLYAVWPNAGYTAATWVDLGAAPDAALSLSTLIPGYSTDTVLIVATAGLYAYRLPELLAPGATLINGNVGVATASGLQAAIGQPTLIAGQVGAADASGLSASIALNTGILAGVGVATASGLQASIAQGLVIAGGIGEAQASGLQAAISLGSNVTIAAGVGVAQALGLGAQIITSTNIAAAVGEAQASGLPASITVASGTTIAGGVGEAAASGLPAAITFPGPVTISCNVGAADAIGLRAIIRTLGLLPEYAAQPNTASSWSYKRTATLWSLVSRDEWGGQTTHAEPVLFRCDYATDSKRAVTAAGDEFTTRLLVYTSLPGVKQGDMLLIGATAERDPYQAGAHEVRAVTEFGDTFSADGPPDFRIAT